MFTKSLAQPLNDSNRKASLMMELDVWYFLSIVGFPSKANLHPMHNVLGMLWRDCGWHGLGTIDPTVGLFLLKQQRASWRPCLGHNQNQNHSTWSLPIPFSQRLAISPCWRIRTALVQFSTDAQAFKRRRLSLTFFPAFPSLNLRMNSFHL